MRGHSAASELRNERVVCAPSSMTRSKRLLAECASSDASCSWSTCSTCVRVLPAGGCFGFQSQPNTLAHGKYCSHIPHAQRAALQHAHLEHVHLIAPPRREVALVEVREVVAVRRLVGPRRAQRDGA